MDFMPIIIEITDSKTLIIAITGLACRLGLPTGEFFKAAGLTETSKIIISDQSKHKTLGGLPPNFSTFSDLFQYIKDEITKYNPGQLIVTGNSGGAFTAMLFGHLLNANYVVAFANPHYLTDKDCKKLGDPSLNTMARLIRELDKLPANVKKYLDLKDVLAKWNGMTQYYIHVSRFRKWDYRPAMILKDIPGVTIITHPFFTHAVTRTLADNNNLRRCFEFPYIDDSIFIKSVYFLKNIPIHFIRRFKHYLGKKIMYFSKLIHHD